MNAGSAIYTLADLRSRLRDFDAALSASDLRPSASSSYVGSAERFVRWLGNDYQPRNAGRTIRPTASSPWSSDELERQLLVYRHLLEEARLRPLAVQTYMHSAAVFLRWLRGSYRPREAAHIPAAIRPGALASDLGVNGLTLRAFLRARYPRSDDERGSAWYLTSEQVDEVRRHFADRAGVGPVPIPKAEPAERDNAHDRDVPTDWFWEGHVQDVVLKHLLATGWHIDQLANTAARARGHDIAASRAGQHLIVEVKGYPSIGYRDPRRANEVKRTQPSLQAKHWFADALLKAVRMRSVLPPRTLIALAFPDFPRYRSLVADTEAVLSKLGISVLLTTETRTINELIPIPEPPTSDE